MSRKLTIIIVFAAIICRCLELTPVIASQSGGLWRDDAGQIDSLGTAFALRLLDICGEELACSTGKISLLVNDEGKDHCLFSELPRRIAQYPNGWENLEQYRGKAGGWMQAPGGFPDVISTAVMSRFITYYSSPEDWLDADRLFLKGELENGITNLRQRCWICNALSLLGDNEAQEAEVTSDVAGDDIQSLALLAQMHCLQDNVNVARGICGQISSLVNASGAWGEAPGLSDDLLTTCLVLEAQYELNEHEVSVISSGRLLEGDFILSDVFQARDYACFTLSPKKRSFETSLRIFNSSGECLGEPTKNGDYYSWFTESHAPGEYHIAASFSKLGSGEVAYGVECAFVIVESRSFEQLSLEFDDVKPCIYQGENWRSKLLLQWDYVANVDSDCLVAWRLKDSSGTPLEASLGAMEVHCDKDSIMQSCAILPENLVIKEAGYYTWEVELSCGDETLSASRKIYVRHHPVVRVENYVTPETIGGSEAQVTMVLRLIPTGLVDENCAVAFNVVNAPLLYTVQDDEGILVELSGISDEFGNLLEEDWLACTVPVGRMFGDKSLSTNRQCGDACAVRVANGAGHFVYYPDVAVMQNGDCATIVIRVWAVGSGLSLEEQIGTVELHLNKVE